ncbi:41918_t:CDS:2, partial [Gigaspora margarita]
KFKKFAVIQNEKVSGKDKEIVKLLKTNANIEEVTKEVLIKQECGCQDYSIQELINKIPNLEAEEQNNSKGLEMKIEERKAKQVGTSIIQEKENCEILAVMSQILTRLNKLEKQQENKEQDLPAPIASKGASVILKEKGSNKEVATTIDNKSDLEIRKLWKAIKDINRVFQKLKKKEKLIDPKDKEDLKTIQKLYKTNLNILLGTIDEDINKEDLTKLCKEWAKIVHKEWKFKKERCQMNEDFNIAMEHCTFRKQLRSKKRTLQNSWLKRAEEANKFWLEVLLESIMGKKHGTQSISNTLHIDNLQMPIIKIVTRKEELINMHLEESQIAEKLKLIAEQIREKEGIAKDNKRKLQTAAEIADLKSSKKQKGKEKQIIQPKTNSVDSQPEQ